MKPKTIYLHFNKQGSSKGFPWTVHTSSACIPAAEVRILVPLSTVWKPDKKTNPRAFLKAKGRIRFDNDVLVVY